jgi:hypothetical protein
MKDNLVRPLFGKNREIKGEDFQKMKGFLIGNKNQVLFTKHILFAKSL